MNFDRITGRLLVGSEPQTASDVGGLVAEGVTLIVDLRTEWHNQYIMQPYPEVRSIWSPTEDDGLYKNSTWFNQAVLPMVEGLLSPKTLIYLHCAAGISRSPSMAYAFLRYLGLTSEEAEFKIMEARPQAMLTYKVDAERWLRESRRSAVKEDR